MILDIGLLLCKDFRPGPFAVQEFGIPVQVFVVLHLRDCLCLFAQITTQTARKKAWLKIREDPMSLPSFSNAASQRYHPYHL